MCFGPLERYALWLECVEVVENGLEEGEFGREFGEFGGDAVYDVGDGSTVGVDGVILLLWEVPSAEGQTYDYGSEFHVGRLRANLGTVVEGEEDCSFLLPGGALGDYGDPCIAGAVGGVALFLEDAEEVVAVVFPSTIYVYGVLGWQRYVLW